MQKKVLITGGAGFIGSNFARRVIDLQYQIHIIEKEGANLWRLEGIKDKLTVHHVDLADCPALEELVIKLQPNIILHFAAYGVYPKKQKEVSEAVTTNITGTINLVNACSKITFDCFINTGSSDEYGQKQKPIKETDSLEPNNLYAITKTAATLYCKMMARKFDLPIVIVQPFMMYGYFEERDRLIPTVIKCCLTGAKLELSQPSSVRDFIFIEDVIEAYLQIIKNAANIKGEIFNIGGGKQASIKEVVSLVKKYTGSAVEPTYGTVTSAYQEPKNWTANISKAKKLLDWKPAHSLEKGLQKNIAWFKENIDLYT